MVRFDRKCAIYELVQLLLLILSSIISVAPMRGFEKKFSELVSLLLILVHE